MKQVESSPGRKASKIRTIAVESTAQAYLEILQDRGVRYIFGNGGTDFAPILDAFARRSVLGRASDAPVPIIVPHENVAMSMAHGAYLVSGELQVVMVHVGVGTANSLVGVINASRTNIPILLTAGRTPITEEGQLGSRNNYINWGQECFDQAGMLREYVKWDYELRNCEQLETVVDRAMEVAMAEPRGPVYLTLPREVLGAECQSMEITSPARHHTSARRFPDSESIREAAQILMDARSPLLITSSIGSSAEGVRQLVDLVDAFSIPVVIMPKISRYMNFPSNHPLHLGYDSHPFLADADVIVVLESDTPWYPSRAKPRADAQIIHIAEDPWYVRYPL